MTIFVRNNTTSSVINLSVIGVAYTADGNMYATGKDMGLNPIFVRPGEISLGRMEFGFNVNLPSDATYTFEVTAEPANSPGFFRDLDVIEVNLVENRLVGLFMNNQDVAVHGIFASAYCFDETGKLLNWHINRPDKDTAQPLEQVSVQIEIGSDSYPIYLVTGSGYVWEATPFSISN